MKIKHKDLEIPEGNPFANCRLNRRQYANVLTGIVSTYADGFVLAINNEWGAGKTTFVKMWEQQLKVIKFQTIYFNAWENDFDNNPMVAILSELEVLTKSKDNKVFKSLLEKGAVITKNVLPELIKALLKKHVLGISDEKLDIITDFTKASSEILSDEIKEYNAKKKSIKDFKNELEKFINDKVVQKPLIFIVDELDRCRPNYAVEVLENIKHLFSVKGIVFVLSIDKNHLGSSIKGFYGSESINSNEYLRRFIDLEYSIPEPSIIDFANYLFNYYNFGAFFSNNVRIQFEQDKSDPIRFIWMAEAILSKENTSLRVQERIFALTRLALCSFSPQDNVFPHILFILVYLKIKQPEIYYKLSRNEYKLQALCVVIEDLLPLNPSMDARFDFAKTLATFLCFYNNNSDNLIAIKQKRLISDSSTPIIKSIWFDSGKTFADHFNELNSTRRMFYDLTGFIKKINLTEGIVSVN